MVLPTRSSSLCAKFRTRGPCWLIRNIQKKNKKIQRIGSISIWSKLTTRDECVDIQVSLNPLLGDVPMANFHFRKNENGTP
uniref:Uncharacterized protein n=1 Tax=Nelumbo nucifera TaxID=4432 RepID=A0A822XPQ4_NELNU|nr:TPA_asm: hypothetical protein HUJ06_023126 [Nelumbo nucifera]